MTFRAVLKERARVLGSSRIWCGNLPTGYALFLSFAEHRHSDNEAHFPGPVHQFAAGLVAAHHDAAGIGVDPDHIIEQWDTATTRISVYRNEIDSAVPRLIPKATGNAVPYPESIGTFISRMAHLYCHSPKVGPPLGNPIRANSSLLKAQLLDKHCCYANLIANLNVGLVRLPEVLN